MQIKFLEDPPVQKHILFELRLHEEDNLTIDIEVARLLEIGAASESKYEPGQFVSSVY